MIDGATTPARPGRSWRDINQEVTPRAMSPKGRRRRHLAWIKLSAVVGVTASVAGLGYAVAHEWSNDRAALATAVHSERVREVTVITDGTLTRAWVENVLALPRDATLMGLDLPALRDRLAAQGQIRVAVLSRSFPDMLVVNLQERTPVARLQVDDGAGRPKQLFVAKDGVAYEGVNYDPAMVASLPWLDGIRLARNGGRFAPVEGMAEVASLLNTAQLQAPHLYRTWMIVSLARLAEHDEIVVKAQDVPEIVFSRREDYFKQIAQLDYVLETTQRLPEAGVQSVNLALGGRVPVRLGRTPDEIARVTANPDFQLPTKQRRGNRDL